jgi:uncharacterized glyoxalase superfamily protein PhnB
MAVPRRLSVVVLGVAELSVSAAFYDCLGWPRSSASSDEIVFYGLAGCVLALHPVDLLAADAVQSARGSGFGGITQAVNVETADAVQPALDAAAAAGGVVLKPATRADWGGISGYFADPDGHPWEVAWNPSFGFTPDGRVVLP